MREEDTLHERGLELMKIGVQAVLDRTLEVYLTKVVTVSEVVCYLETLGLDNFDEKESNGWDIWVTLSEGQEDHCIVEGSAYDGSVKFYLKEYEE